ncbi:hypothetical protein D3C71_1858500 [compost metagenome]
MRARRAPHGIQQPGRHVHDRVTAHVRKQHAELLAAHAADMVARAQRGRGQQAEMAQHGIARHVAMRIVDALEIIDIQQQQGQRPPRA